MMPVEFLFFALFFILLASSARKYDTDRNFLGKLRIWTLLQGALFVIFTILVYTMKAGFMTPYGAVYLISLGIAFGVTLRMKQTVEAVAR